MTKPKLVSLFTGAGGMDEGFKAAGFDVIACMDIEKWACDTLKKNNPTQIIVGPNKYSGDIKSISASDFSDITGLKVGDIDILIGGPPCQPFSQAASQRFIKEDIKFKRKGFGDKEKGTLLFEYIKYVKHFMPSVFVLENVPGLLTIDGGIQLRECLKELENIGYSHTEPTIVDAADYGVPQHRKRLIIWGTLERSIIPEIPFATHSNDRFTQPHNSVAHALTDINEPIHNHETRKHKPESIARYRELEFGQREKLGRIDRLDPYKPSKTVIAGGMKGGGRSHLHPFIARTLSVRECARLQTFKDDFIFTGSIARQFTQVGNAVPPLLAEHFARKIIQDVFRITPQKNFTHLPYISTKPIDSLVNDILKKSFKENPDWIYYSHYQDYKLKKVFDS